MILRFTPGSEVRDHVWDVEESSEVLDIKCNSCVRQVPRRLYYLSTSGAIYPAPKDIDQWPVILSVASLMSTHTNDSSWNQNDNTVGRTFCLHLVNLGSLPGILYCSPSLPEVIFEDRTGNNFLMLLDVLPHQKR